MLQPFPKGITIKIAFVYAFRKRLQHNNAERDKITWTSEPFLDILQNYASPNKYRIMIIPKYKQNEQRLFLVF
jgi:UDP-N-acetylglucosamine 2-epimerase